MRVRLPEEVSAIYRAVDALSAKYPGRPFTPDGHLVGSIGEVIAAEALGLTLYPPSKPGHDAFDAGGDVQIKMTAGKAVSMYSCCDRLVVMKVLNPEEAEIVYDGDGAPAWDRAGPMQKNGQRRISLAKLAAIKAEHTRPVRPVLADEHPLSIAAERASAELLDEVVHDKRFAHITTRVKDLRGSS